MVREIKKAFREIESSSPIKLPMEVSFMIGFDDDMCIAGACSDEDGTPMYIEFYTKPLAYLISNFPEVDPRMVIKSVVIHEYSHLVQTLSYGDNDIRRYYECHLDSRWTDTYRTIAYHFGVPREFVEADIEFCKEYDTSPEWRNYIEEWVKEWRETEGILYNYEIMGKFGWLQEEE